ncbi:MAG TPA: hypothetical protein VGY58_00225, partial [Gemmataceae bacterium]|nr:hypothetical protein [Gemmataceae bacterium]
MQVVPEPTPMPTIEAGFQGNAPPGTLQEKSVDSNAGKKRQAEESGQQGAAPPANTGKANPAPAGPPKR